MHSLKDLIFVFIRFFGAYGLMLYFYNIYLEAEAKKSSIDLITRKLSVQISDVLNSMGISNQLKEAKNSMVFYMEDVGRIVSYINEGCNGVSVMIIFVAFSIAFYSDFFKTIGFIVFGLIIIYVSNFLRIILLNIIFLEYNQYAKFSHDIIFPVIIYGTVLLLWIYWINNLKLNKTNGEKSI